jgi:multiple sugar transport system permease protein
LDNFAAVLWDPEFWQSLAASIWYAFLSITMGFAAPIALAILLHEIPKGKTFYRTIYYLPAVVSGLVVMLMWRSFFGSAERGLLNQIITGIPPWAFYATGGILAAACLAASAHSFRGGHTTAGVVFACTAGLFALGITALWKWADLPMKPQDWLGDRRWAMACIVLPTVWAGMGPGCLIYLAALKTIPDDLYEAADLDGAGFFNKIWHITIPSIQVLIVINFIGAVVGSFRVAEYILAMTGGGPGGATQVLALKVFYDSFVFLRFGFATATAWIFGAMLVGFTVYQLKRLSSVEFKAGG